MSDLYLGQEAYDDIGIDGPYSRFAERACIGSSLVQESAFRQICNELEPHHFWSPFCREAFVVIQQIAESGTIAEPEAVRIGMKDNGMSPEKIEDFLMQMAIEFTIECSHIGRYIQILKEKWVLRQCMALGKDASQQGATARKSLKWIDDIRDGAKTTRTEIGLIGDYFNENKRKGATSCLDFINSSTITEGWAHGQMHLVCAYRGGGKTAFMIQDAIEVATLEGPVVYGTFADLGSEDLARRMVKSMCGFSSTPRDTNGVPEYRNAVNKMKSLPIHVLDATKLRGSRDIEGFASDVRKLHEKEGLKAIYVDYVQKVKTRNTKVRTDLDRLTEVSDVIQWLSAETDVPTIVGSQLTLGSEKMGTVDISKGGRVLEEDCATMLKLKIYKEEDRLKLPEPYASTPGAALIQIDKNRFGKSDLSQMHRWNERKARFEEL